MCACVRNFRACCSNVARNCSRVWLLFCCMVDTYIYRYKHINVATLPMQFMGSLIQKTMLNFCVTHQTIFVFNEKCRFTSPEVIMAYFIGIACTRVPLLQKDYPTSFQRRYTNICCVVRRDCRIVYRCCRSLCARARCPILSHISRASCIVHASSSMHGHASAPCFEHRARQSSVQRSSSHEYARMCSKRISARARDICT